MKRIGLLIGAAGLLVAATAFAGSKSWYQVTFGSNYAYGTVPGAYFASDTTQLIGCNSYAYASGSSSGSCYAYTSSGAFKQCITSNPAMLAVIQSVGPMSYVYFRLAADNYACEQVSVTNGSHYGAY